MQPQSIRTSLWRYKNIFGVVVALLAIVGLMGLVRFDVAWSSVESTFTSMNRLSNTYLAYDDEAQTEGTTPDRLDSTSIFATETNESESAEATAEDGNKLDAVWRKLKPIASGANTALPKFEASNLPKGFDILKEADARKFYSLIIGQPEEQRIKAFIIPHQEGPFALSDTSWFMLITQDDERKKLPNIKDEYIQNGLILKSLRKTEKRENRTFKRQGHSYNSTESWLIPPAWKYYGHDINNMSILTYALNRHDENNTRFNELHHVWIDPNRSTDLVGFSLTNGYSRMRSPYADLADRLKMTKDTSSKNNPEMEDEVYWNVEDYISQSQVTLAEKPTNYSGFLITALLLGLLNSIVMAIIWLTEGASTEVFVPKGAERRR